MNETTITQVQNIGQILSKHMKDNNISKYALANKIGMTRWQMNFILNAKANYTIESFLKVLNGLELPFSVLDDL